MNRSVVNWSQIRLLGDDSWALQREHGGMVADQAIQLCMFKIAMLAHRVFGR